MKTKHYYCPLIVNHYEREEYFPYGINWDNPTKYDGYYAALIEREIRKLIENENKHTGDMSQFFDDEDSASANAKIKSIIFGVALVNDVLYGCITVSLTEDFTEEEDEAFKDWASGQASDGYGEGLEQREMCVSGGWAYVSFWHSGDDWFLYNDEEFAKHLQKGKQSEKVDK